MTAYLLADHLLNFALPAAVVALLLVGLSRIFGRFLGLGSVMVLTLKSQLLVVFAVNIGILLAGLLAFGHDGKMLTYAAMVAGAAACQWFLLRGWKS